MALLNFLSWSHLISLFALFCLFIIIRSIYRLTLHPLAKFPGPKGAAVSSFYGAFWDVPSRSSYIKEFPTWHDKYKSPIIRISPNQLRIRDFDSHNNIFRMRSNYWRDPSFYQLPCTKGSFRDNTSIDVNEGLAHRALYNQCFSQSAIRKLEPNIQDQLRNLISAIDDMRRREVPVDLSLGFKCFSADTLGSCMFDRSFDFLKSPDFQCETILQLEEMVDTYPLTWYGGRLIVQMLQLLGRLPRS